MEFSIKSDYSDSRNLCVVAGVFEARRGRFTLFAKQIDQVSGGYLTEFLQRGEMEGKLANVLMLHHVPGMTARVLLVGLGKEKTYREAEFRKVVRAAVTALDSAGIQRAFLSLTSGEAPQDTSWRIRQAVLVAEEALYRFTRCKSKKLPPRRHALRHLTLAADSPELSANETALSQGRAIAEGVRLARDLGNLPANICTPEYLAETARDMASELKLACTILTPKKIAAEGMEALLAVARGSRQEARFIHIEYNPSKSMGRPLVLVGKGITFDSGGISLKPAAGMDEMKYDMCGAAAVLGVLRAAARMALPVPLVALIPCCENMPGGAAARPGDIVRSLSGQSIEILNTDAEGRLLLCDALAYAKRCKPVAIIDVATLTGACVVALGHVASGLFTQDEDLARALAQAAETAQDRLWRLPLWEEYGEALKSGFADIANVGGRDGGAITAASFLSRFVDKKIPWAHLDIAGTAWSGDKEKGATGRPVALLCHYLLQRAQARDAPADKAL
ncbi:MAG: leucyl aminopeptidase [Zoogloeaceae bacterium]|jgi:leucyl aminopeptidase|nr:leucyl aminopeptidase [Zoogloeaceae bacterium]